MQTLKWAEQSNFSLLTIALNHLVLGRAALYWSVLESHSVRSESAHTSTSAPLALSPEEQRGLTSAATELETAVAGLRRAGTQHMIPLALLTRAWCSAFAKATADKFFVAEATADKPPNKLLNLKQEDYEMSAWRDLDEAWEIAERGPMPLFLADIHLHRARLFHAVTPYPWAMDPDGHARGPHADLAEVRRLIEKHGYWRRKEELEDAEAALENWPRT